jgi:hypothetical protein
VVLGYYGDRFGLMLLVGKKVYVYQPGLPALKVFDGIYVAVGGGG